MLQRSLSGEFQVEALAPETWSATNRRPPGQILLLRRVQTSAALRVPTLAAAVTVTWQAGQPVAVTFVIDGQPVAVVAGAAFLHEPAGPIYAGLPLAVFTAGMQRFWRRVFWLVRLPGGRLLLRWLARRRTAGARPD
jgi:hypothetical protein